METTAKSENKMRICEKLWNENLKSIRNICEYKLSSYPSEVDEVVSEAFLALCNAIKNDTIDENPKAWLYGTVNNLIKTKYTEINIYKKRIVNLDSIKGELLYEVDFDLRNVNNEVVDEVKNIILGKLSDSDITFLNLIYEENKKYKEVAEILGTTQPAVKQRHYRLKLRIQQMAKEEFDKKQI